ncbi:MAG: sulfite exporter TauE/SafE family protein [Puniceicoccaceae bacterium]
MMLGLDLMDCAIGILAALLVGLGKGGLPGAGNLSVILMAMIFPSRESVGILLPILICADVVAVAVYHSHTQWTHLWRLLPWTLLGVVAGAFVFQNMDDALLTRVIGAILLLMVALTPLRKYFQQHPDELPGQRLTFKQQAFVGSTGVLGGVATMVANAAGPVIGIYLMMSRLPKFAFIGTAAWFFFIINLCKMPIQVGIGNITWASLKLSAGFGVFAVVAAMIAPRLMKWVPQHIFSFLVWLFIVVAGVKMLLF